ncbi:hypothetical protein GS597_19645 [Synechococcales cyanobacterium C]|uniref:Uncharacterized protein n=1 Tax=Petrachloros mirabilis ULC683 TaxID=2781853 RepID=A0A8K2A9W0_9CYAN|nr:hypothetical protein [Petrachloros mirabilis]NCJ08679.1 hypothetical protein [Petrachloros mirabilis ULC683]
MANQWAASAKKPQNTQGTAPKTPSNPATSTEVKAGIFSLVGWRVKAISIFTPIKGKSMQIITHDSAAIGHVLSALKKAGSVLKKVTAAAYSFGQAFYSFVYRIMAQAETIETLQSQTDELATLKQQISQLEAKLQKIDALEAKTYAHHCKLVLLERGRRFNSRAF